MKELDCVNSAWNFVKNMTSHSDCEQRPRTRQTRMSWVNGFSGYYLNLCKEFHVDGFKLTVLRTRCCFWKIVEFWLCWRRVILPLGQLWNCLTVLQRRENLAFNLGQIIFQKYEIKDKRNLIGVLGANNLNVKYIYIYIFFKEIFESVHYGKHAKL